MGYPDITNGAYSVTANRARIDVDAVHAYLTRSFWARGISKDLVTRSIQHSLCFGVFDHESQVAFARVVTDYSTYAYLCDVYVLETHRGKGLSKWMMEFVMNHPDLQGVRRFQLVPPAAHVFYPPFGSPPPVHPDRHLEIFRDGMYE